MNRYITLLSLRFKQLIYNNNDKSPSNYLRSAALGLEAENKRKRKGGYNAATIVSIRNFSTAILVPNYQLCFLSLYRDKISLIKYIFHHCIKVVLLIVFMSTNSIIINLFHYIVYIFLKYFSFSWNKVKIGTFKRIIVHHFFLGVLIQATSTKANILPKSVKLISKFTLYLIDS